MREKAAQYILYVLLNPQVENIMSFIIAVALISVWTHATGKTLGPSTSTN